MNPHEGLVSSLWCCCWHWRQGSSISSAANGAWKRYKTHLLRQLGRRCTQKIHLSFVRSMTFSYVMGFVWFCWRLLFVLVRDAQAEAAKTSYKGREVWKGSMLLHMALVDWSERFQVTVESPPLGLSDWICMVISQRKTHINQVMWCQCVKFRCIHATKGPGRKQRDMHSARIRKREDQHVYWFATLGYAGKMQNILALFNDECR